MSSLELSWSPNIHFPLDTSHAELLQTSTATSISTALNSETLIHQFQDPGSIKYNSAELEQSLQPTSSPTPSNNNSSRHHHFLTFHIPPWLSRLARHPAASATWYTHSFTQTHMGILSTPPSTITHQPPLPRLVNQALEYNSHRRLSYETIMSPKSFRGWIKRIVLRKPTKSGFSKTTFPESESRSSISSDWNQDSIIDQYEADALGIPSATA